MVTLHPLLESPKLLGARVKRMEDPRLITGGGSYIDDIKLPGTVHMQIVRSPYAHARIVAINAAAARQMPGVIAVWTGADVRAAGQMPPANVAGFKVGVRYLLAVDKARHVGDPIVAVVAETRYQARDAAMAVEIEYEVLPAAASAADAQADGAAQLHESAPGNIAATRNVKSGDIEQAFREADRVVSGAIVQPKLIPLFLEPRVTLAQWDAKEQKLTAWASTQNAHRHRLSYCDFFGLDEQHVRVIAPDIGGGFGAKADNYPDDLLAPWAAMQLGRPVKYLEDRRDNFSQTGHGRGQVTELEAAVKNDGAILGVRIRMTSDIGAYVIPGGASQSNSTLAMGVGAYRFPAVDYQATVVYTNTTPVTWYRGAGRPEAAYMMERLVEFVAFDLGLDPVEVRRRNLIQPTQFPYRTPTGRTYDSGNYQSALDLALKTANYDALRQWQTEQRAQGKIVGIGLSVYVEVTGGGPTAQGAERGSLGSATIRVEPSGFVNVYTGASPHGQGTETSFAQIVGDVLGIGIDRIRVLHGDTDVVQVGNGTGASRTMPVSANAVFLAVAKVREKVHRLAGAMLEANPDDITLEDDRFIVKGSPGRGLTFAEVARRAYAPWGIPRDIEPGLEASFYFEPSNPVFPFGAHLVVVEIDGDTGKVKLQRFVAVDDVGRVISPMLMEGQIHGGVAQGIAAALCEGVVYDENGQLVTATLMDYAAVRADNLPPIEVLHHSTLSPLNPLGTKGAGESGTVGATPAVVNAVMDALKPFGVRNVDMPLTPEKVWRAMQGR